MTVRPKFKLMDAIDAHEHLIQLGGDEPDSDFGSLEHNLTYLSAAVKVLKEHLSPKQQIEILEDFLLHASPGMKENFLPLLTKLDPQNTLEVHMSFPLKRIASYLESSPKGTLRVTEVTQHNPLPGSLGISSTSTNATPVAARTTVNPAFRPATA